MKTIKDLMGKIISRGPLAVTLSVIVSVLFVTGIINAATTISTNIQTDGTLSVTGLGTLGSASTTIFSVNNTAFFGGTASTTIGVGGNITQPTTNSATTTIIVGCIQAYATSTATAVRLEFGAAAIAAASSTTFRTGAAIGQGQVLWAYGTCS